MIVRNNTTVLNKMEQSEYLTHILSQLILDLKTFCKVIFQKCLPIQNFSQVHYSEGYH